MDCWMLEYRYKNAIENIDKLKNEVLEIVKKAEATERAYADTAKMGGVKTFKTYPTFQYVTYDKDLKSTSYSSPEEALRQIEETFAKCQEIKAENLAIIEHNSKVLKCAMNFMLSLGLKEKQTEYKGRYRKAVETRSEWVTALATQIPINDGWYNVESRYRDVKRSAEEWAEKVRRITAEKERQAKQAEQETQLQRIIGSLFAKYGCDATVSPDDLLDAILAKDKYLRLAYYLERNRIDWNDGCDYAERGLSHFTIESPRDQEIYDDISGQMGEDWDGDGRVFRDIKWGYDALYALVDPKLMEDYRILQEACCET